MLNLNKRHVRLSTFAIVCSDVLILSVPYEQTLRALGIIEHDFEKNGLDYEKSNCHKRIGKS